MLVVAVVMEGKRSLFLRPWECEGTADPEEGSASRVMGAEDGGAREGMVSKAVAKSEVPISEEIGGDAIGAALEDEEPGNCIIPKAARKDILLTRLDYKTSEI